MRCVSQENSLINVIDLPLAFTTRDAPSSDWDLADRIITDDIHHTHHNSCHSSHTSHTHHNSCRSSHSQTRHTSVSEATITQITHTLQYIKVIMCEICIMQKSVLLGFSFITRETRKRVCPEADAHSNSSVWHWEMKSSYEILSVMVRTIIRLTRDEPQTLWKPDLCAWWRCKCVSQVRERACVWIHEADEWSERILGASEEGLWKHQSINELFLIFSLEKLTVNGKTHIHTLVLILPPARDDYEKDQFMTSVKSFPPVNTGRATIIKLHRRLT